MSDARAVARVLGGDRDAYALLVQEHQQALYRHLRGMGVDHDTTLDLVQDAFVKAYERLPDCREPARFGSWVVRIARNLCLDYLKNVRRLTVPLSSVPQSSDIPAATSDDADGILRSALAALPVSMREAFLLKHDAGYTYEEIAEITKASPSAVKMRVHRARETLREYLEKHGVRAA